MWVRCPDFLCSCCKIVFFPLLWICKTAAIVPSGKNAICTSALLFLWWWVGYLLVVLFKSHTPPIWCCNWDCYCCEYVFHLCTYVHVLALFSMFWQKRWFPCWQRERSDTGRRRYPGKRWITAWLQATQNPSPAARWAQWLPAVGLQTPRIQCRHGVCWFFADSGDRKGPDTAELVLWQEVSLKEGNPSLQDFATFFGQKFCPWQVGSLPYFSLKKPLESYFTAR